MDILGRGDNINQVFVGNDLGQYTSSDRIPDWKSGKLNKFVFNNST